jgi:serine/threonine protein kinase
MTISPIDKCLSEESLRQLADDQLLPAELQQIEQHVTGCPRCREILEAAENDRWWKDDVCSILKTAEPFSLPGGDFDETGPQDESLTAVVRMLGPSDDPRMMGRIGTYEIVGILGRGGMGVVFKASDAPLNRFVAIKMLLPHLAASGAARKRFAREGRAAAAVIDDNVMPIYHVAEWQGVPYLVTQYSGGVTLQKRIEQHGPLELKQILRIGLQTAKGLAAAHAQGLVHRDVKPSNILLDETVERATLTDFGLARAVDDATITRTGFIAGTPQYMSPEQVRSGHVDARSDLFSLGSVLYAMCTGRPPFQADNSYAILRRITDEQPRSIREINPDIPSWMSSTISKLMSKQPDDRYQSANEVAELLTGCLAHVQQPQITSLPSSLVTSESQTRSRFRLFRAAAISMMGIIGLGLIMLAMLQLPSDKPKPPERAAKGDRAAVDSDEQLDSSKGTDRSKNNGRSVDAVNQEFLQRVQNEQKNVFPSLPFKVNAEGQVVELSMYEFQLQPGDALTISRMTMLTRLNLQGSNISDDDLRHLSRLTNLEELNLWHTRIGNAGVAAIVGMTSLKSLQLGDTKITDSALPDLGKLTELRQLALARTKITDEGLKSLVTLKHLVGLKLSETRITDEGLKTLDDFLALRGVTLDETAVTFDGILQFAKREGFDWMTSDEGVANELARRQRAGHPGDVESMLGIGLELPHGGKFAIRSVSAHPLTAKDTERGRRRFRVEWDWNHDNHAEGLFAELAIRQGTARVIEAGVLESVQKK